jgi:hypothetical protein
MGNDLQQFNALSKQRLDYTSLPGGGQRARMTITLPNGKSFTFVEDVTPADVKKYATEIAGVEIGCAMARAPISGVEVGNIFGDIAKGLGSGFKAIAKVAKKVVTSKVMQTAAKGLAMIAPALGPMAPAAIAVSGGIGVAGKLLASKTAQSVNAPLASQQLAASAVSDAKRLTKSPGGLAGLLKIASHKAANVGTLVNKLVSKAPPPKPNLLGVRLNAPMSAARAAVNRSFAAPSDMMQAARLGKLRSNSGGAVTPAQLTAAANLGRVFFLAA